MAIERRKFLKELGAFALAGRLWKAPRRYVEAVRASVYPGPRRRFDPDEIAKPGKWAG